MGGCDELERHRQAGRARLTSVISCVLGWPVAGRMVRPPRTMNTASKRISARNAHERLALRGPRDERRNLADTVDRLLERLDSAFDAQKRFVANPAHERRIGRIE